MKAVVAAFNQEKALVGAFSVITNLRMELFEALVAHAGRVPVLPPPARQTYHWAENVIICANCPGHRATNGHHYRYYMAAEAKLQFQCRNTKYL